MMASSEKQIINKLTFNQDKSCFICCMDNGLRIFHVDPMVEKIHYDERTIGGVGFCEMVWRCNLFAIVSGGNKPKYGDNTVLVYDDRNQSAILSLTFSQPVLTVRCDKKRMAVVLKNRIHIFSFPHQPQKLFTLETRANPLGLCELSPGTFNLLVFPGSKVGSMQFLDLATTEASVSSSPVTINAHQGELACIAINTQGTQIATASEKGTLIRVWDSQKRIPLIEFRRGSDNAKIYCINFSPSSDFLCCSSDKGTVHIFALKDTKLNQRSTFSRISFVGQYVQSMWGVTAFTIAPECACICAFSSKNEVVAICVDGTYHKYIFNPDRVPKECSRLAFDVFLDMCDDDEF